MKPKFDLEDMQIGCVHVDSYDTKSLWNCTCKCGKKIKVKTFNLKEAIRLNKNYACEECSAELRRNDITGKQINDWKIIEYVGDGFYKCQCKCGKVYNIKGKTIKSGKSKSCRDCGCKKMIQTRLDRYDDIATNVKERRTEEQVIACSSSEDMREFILNNFNHKPKALEISRLLGISECMALRKIHKFGLDGYIEIDTGSVIESDVVNYIKSIYNGNIIERDRKVLSGSELDIYIPDKNLAIEVNGDYWHSNIFKNTYYHQIKSLKCLEEHIHLIHIFEYEWKNKNKRDKLESYIETKLSDSNTLIDINDTLIKEINTDELNNFRNKYDIHEYQIPDTSMNIGCYYSNELIGIMTFNKIDSTNRTRYKILANCWKPHIEVKAGQSKLFEYLTREYRPSSIVVYVDLAKFTGNSYVDELGFREIEITEPNYIWLNNQTYEIIEDNEINNGYLKIYNSGNLKLERKDKK
jgi:hypothetical protein